MRKKEIVAAAIVVLVAVLAFGGYKLSGLYGKWQFDAAIERERQEIADTARYYTEGEEVSYASPDDSLEFRGEISLRVDGASLYENLRQAGLLEKARDAYEDLLGPGSSTEDDRDIVVYQVTMKNVSANPLWGQYGQDEGGYNPFIIGKIAGLHSSSDQHYETPVYVEGAMAGHFNYFYLDPGEERRFAVAYAVEEQGDDPAEFEVEGPMGVKDAYHITLDLKDMRKGEASS